MTSPIVPLVTLNSGKCSSSTVIIAVTDHHIGYRIPQIGLGLWELPERDQCKKVVREAFDEGYRLIDTAQVSCDLEFAS
jgi:hypothetical protein